MEATELRIGNYISSETIGQSGKIKGVPVLKILPEDIETIFSFPENYNPISLTEEWLLEFGFVKIRDYPVFSLNDIRIEFNGFVS